MPQLRLRVVEKPQQQRQADGAVAAFRAEDRDAMQVLLLYLPRAVDLVSTRLSAAVQKGRGALSSSSPTFLSTLRSSREPSCSASDAATLSAMRPSCSALRLRSAPPPRPFSGCGCGCECTCGGQQLAESQDRALTVSSTQSRDPYAYLGIDIKL